MAKKERAARVDDGEPNEFTALDTPPTITSIEYDSTHSIAIRLSDGRTAKALIAGQKSTADCAVMRDVIVAAFRRTVK